MKYNYKNIGLKYKKDMAGTLDTTFGTNGYTLSDMGGNLYSQVISQVIDSNNCTIVTGFTNASPGSKFQLYLAKYTSTGVLDTAFGGGGKGYILGDYYTGQASRGNSLVLDSTGNILVTGVADDSNGDSRLLLAKYKSIGELDTSFGGGKGWLTSDFGYSSSDYYTAGDSLALDSSGRIVVTGDVGYNSDTRNSVLFVLARYTSSGDLDKTFGGNGTGWANTTDSIINRYGGKSIIIEQTTGSIIVMGRNNGGGGDADSVLVVKFSNNGILDTKFGSGKGYIIVEGETWNSNSDYSGFILDKFNRIIVTSSSNTSVYDNTSDTLLVRYTVDGTLDTAFGENGGYTITTIPNYNSAGIALVIDSNDRIIVTGIVSTIDNTISKTLLLRYTSGGKLDTTFGGSGLGYSINSFGVPSHGVEASFGYAVSLDNNGLIVVSGVASVSTGQDSFIARFYNSDIVTTTSTTTIPYSTTSTTTHYQPICLVAGTPILTDQGIVAIEKIDPKKHSINHKRIIAITKSITPEEHLVVIEANSFGPNVPTQRTIMTPGHHIMVKGSLVPAKNLLGRVRGVHSVPYNGKDVLYNVLMENHDVMIANNMVIETLHPTNKVARRIISELNKQ